MIKGGIRHGDVVMIHSSLSRIGNIKGGAETVIKSILETISYDGVVAMPVYTSVDEAIKCMNKGEPIDLRKSRSGTGIISEIFRTMPGVVRSSHPFSSICVWGNKANEIISDHAINPYICHESSPIGKLLKMNVKLIGIGIPLAQGIGIAHYLEDTWEEFPLEVHAPMFPLKYIDMTGNIIERNIYRCDPEVASTRIETSAGQWICENLTAFLIKRGIMKCFEYGNANSYIMESRPLINELKQLAKRGITIYTTPDKLEENLLDFNNWYDGW